MEDSPFSQGSALSEERRAQSATKTRTPEPLQQVPFYVDPFQKEGPQAVYNPTLAIRRLADSWQLANPDVLQSPTTSWSYLQTGTATSTANAAPDTNMPLHWMPTHLCCAAFRLRIDSVLTHESDEAALRGCLTVTYLVKTPGCATCRGVEPSENQSAGQLQDS